MALCEFQASPGYIVKLCHKTKQKQKQNLLQVRDVAQLVVACRACMKPWIRFLALFKLRLLSQKLYSQHSLTTQQV